MALTLTGSQVALRLLLACVASFVIGLNRDEKGIPAGIRTTMLVCLAATLSMIEVNLLLDMSGKTPSSFAVMDLMRLPLGILSGIGFIGAGVIVKRDNNLVAGVTTAATMWFVTMLGLLFGAGNLVFGSVAAALAIVILWGLKAVEAWIPREHRGTLRVTFAEGGITEDRVRQELAKAGCGIVTWKAEYEPAPTLRALECELTWRDRASRPPQTPAVVHTLRSASGVRSIKWEQG